jgi:hypothetical protein
MYPLSVIDPSVFVTRIRGLLKKAPRYFENLMKRVLINRLDLTMNSQANFQENAIREVKESIEKVREKFEPSGALRG